MVKKIQILLHKTSKEGKKNKRKRKNNEDLDFD
jgi:hypothetical protein